MKTSPSPYKLSAVLRLVSKPFTGAVPDELIARDEPAPVTRTFRSPFSTRHLVILGMLVPVLLMVLVGCLQWKSTAESGHSRDWVTHTRIVQLNLESFLSLVNAAETSQRGYLLTHRDSYLAPYNQALIAIPAQITALRQLTADNPEQQDNVTRLEMLTKARLGDLARTLALEQRKQHDEALLAVDKGTGRKLMDQVRATVGQMKAVEAQLLAYREDIYKRNARFNSRLSAVLVILGVSFTVAIVVLILRMEKMQSMITICAWSKLIDYEGEWLTVEEYLSRRLNARVTHGISRAEAEKMLKLLEQEKLRVDT